ncbi:hypothetical protein NKW45_07760 [Acetobacter orientalis]|uniref:hypothetical protein n=1 Tax=Acetobacter orientalis TaxID=146474 RepID=UPI0020A3377E|nr:hypothetical protein [Acetobacter orientalis]MCP1221741.1 hypothetical protein [Acetobacter orientalis]
MTRFLLLTAGLLSAAAALPAHAAPKAPDYQSIFNRLAAEPLRYAGLSSHKGARILVGLHPTANGALEGEMMRLDSAMRPLAAGPLHGTFSGGTTMSQTAHCTLTITLPGRDIGLNGPCSEQQMSGAMTVRLRPTQLWSQVSHFISPDTSVSQYWLSRAAWQQAITPEGAAQP